MMTTAGSLALVGAKPARDAFIVQQLRGRRRHPRQDQPQRVGQLPLDPFDERLERARRADPEPLRARPQPLRLELRLGRGGRRQLCAAAVGTETDGSIVCPSSACGIVGIKPTLGLLSGSGIIPIAHSQDTAGPMARTVADAAILLGALAGAARATPRRRRGGSPTDSRAPRPRGLRGARIGVARKFFGFNEKVDELMSEAIDVMKSSGAVIIDPADIATPGQFDDSEFEVLLYEFKADLNKYLAGLAPGPHPRTLKALIEFNERNREREMPYFGQEIFIKAEAKGPLTERAYRLALAKNLRLSRAQGIDAVMRSTGSTRSSRRRAARPGRPTSSTAITSPAAARRPAAVAGYPNINVPAGFVSGLPVGISFFGRACSEPTLIRLAYAFEQATKHRRPPRFLPRADLRP